MVVLKLPTRPVEFVLPLEWSAAVAPEVHVERRDCLPALFG